MALLVLWPAILIAVILGTVSGEDTGSYPASDVTHNSVSSSSVGQYVQRYSAPYGKTPSYGVQTGYEGYLVPTPESDTDSAKQRGLLSKLPLRYEAVVLVRAGLWVGRAGPLPRALTSRGRQKAVTDRPNVNT
jgi:hypothetical protein